eukprot:TRINITY_DN11864_c0_g1_i3.p1 TRINITY_DN11864_c0_g1~~TRINITY_DN11864_c0_g1_i3.p1  ORF type:complete len:227 (+),score=44.31 TRINITY_DN11864_c0_g1_i3:214-894(+)
MSSLPADETQYRITVGRLLPDDHIGMSITPMSDHTYKVSELKAEGLVPEWNKARSGAPELIVQEGDFIVAVNGIVGDLNSMMEQFNAMTVLIVLRRSGPPPARPPEEAIVRSEPAAPQTPPVSEKGGEEKQYEDHERAAAVTALLQQSVDSRADWDNERLRARSPSVAAVSPEDVPQATMDGLVLGLKEGATETEMGMNHILTPAEEETTPINSAREWRLCDYVGC